MSDPQTRSNRTSRSRWLPHLPLVPATGLPILLSFLVYERWLDGLSFAGTLGYALAALALCSANVACLVLGYRRARLWTARLHSQRDRAERLSWVAEHTGKMAVIANADGRIEWVNDGFVQITGYRLEDVSHLQPAQLIAGPSVDRSVRARVTRAIREQRDIEAELALHHRDGQPYWVRLEIRVLRHDDGTARAFIALGTDVTELKTVERELAWRAHHDTLTGLANRQTFLARLNLLQSGQQRARAGVCALLSMDFDRFKLINDIHGHMAGDELLCSIARRLETSVSEGDQVARFGGDEYIVLLQDAGSVDNVQRIAARISDVLARPHRLASGIDVSCSASIGVIVLEPGDTRPAELLLSEADAAMYQAKVEARGGYRFFDRALRRQMTRKALLEADLRRADFDEQLRLCYQPIVDLESGAVRGFEALVRWYRHGVEQIPPMDFIPMAEDTGLVVEIGRWVARRACEDLTRWRHRGAGNDITVSINVSRREIIEPGYCEWLIGTVCEYGLSPGDFTLELTETALVDQRLNLFPLAMRLRSLGFRLAMDDFGTGQSSLNSLIDLPIEVLKIDKQFIRNMGKRRLHHTSIAVVHAIVTLAAHLNMAVVAEGLESAEEVATMQAMDCSFGQGFYFARPMTADQALRLMVSGTLPRPALPAHGTVSNLAASS